MNEEELHKKFGVTPEQLDAWADEYESGDWSHMRFGEVVQGLPPNEESLEALREAREMIETGNYNDYESLEAMRADLGV